jgi:5S rRNA maturation endonuclease (ribonuclease M5)
VSAFDDFVRAVELKTGRPGRQVGGQTRLLCPAHDDHNPSLDVKEGADGSPLVQCRSRGCSFEAVCEALGREPRDFLPGPTGPTVVATYDYVDELGSLLFQVVRKSDKTFLQRRPDGNGGWIWKLGDTRRVLYRLPHVIEAVLAGEPVWIVEGEKDVEALERAGVVATTNPMGAGKRAEYERWRSEYARALRGAHVVLVPDLDDLGRDHVRQVAEALSAVAASIEIRLPLSGKDASDHLAAGHAVEGFATAESYIPSGPEPGVEQGAFRVVDVEVFAAVDEPGAAALVVTGEDECILPVGGLWLDFGDGGAGKTTLAIDQLVHWAAGVSWHGMLTPARPLRILLVEVEGPRPEFRRKLRRRLASWDGPPIEGRLQVLEEPWGSVTLRDEHHVRALAELIVEHEYDLVVIGPLRKIGMRGGGTLDEIEEFIALVESVPRLAERLVAFRIIHHENRAGQVSGAWEGVPDTLVHVQPQGNGSLRVFWQKVKWASGLHRTTTQLTWADGEAFAVVDAVEGTEEEKAESLLEAARLHPGASWTTIRKSEAVKGNDTDKARLRDQLIAEGRLVNAPRRKGGYNLWAADDPAFRADAGTEAGTEARAGTPSGAFVTFRASVPAPKGHGSWHGTNEPGSRMAGFGAGSQHGRTDNGPPLIGDEGYLEYLFAALQAGLITEGEWHQGDRAHRLVVGTGEGEERTA